MDLVTSLSDFIIEEHPVHAAASLARQPAVQVVSLLDELPPSHTANIIRHTQTVRAVELLSSITRPAPVIESMSTDDAARILRGADRETAHRLLDGVKSQHARSIRAKISFEADTIGGLTEAAVNMPATTTVHEARELSSSASAPYIYVVDDQSRLLGVVKSAALANQPADAPIAPLMTSPVLCLNQQTPLAAAARHPAWADYDALPVVDSRNELVGIVRHKILRQRVDTKGEWLPLQSAVATLLDLAELYWATGGALMLGAPSGRREPLSQS